MTSKIKKVIGILLILPIVLLLTSAISQLFYLVFTGQGNGLMILTASILLIGMGITGLIMLIDSMDKK